MRLHGIRAIALLSVPMIAAVGCGDDDPPTFVGDPECIGPAGGTIEYVGEDPLGGTEVTAAAGAWDECWSVNFSRETTFTTPDFPTGLHGHDTILTGSLGIGIYRQVDFDEWVYPPDSLEFRISFPRNSLTTQPGEYVTGFWWDEGAGVWRLALPESMDDQRIVIDTHRHDPLWTWGTVDLADADWDLYIAPALEEMHGTEAWMRVQEELAALHESTVPNQLAMTCANLMTVRDLFAGVRDQAKAGLIAFQNGLGDSCGTCDVTSSEFYDSVVDYLQLNVNAYLAELLLIDMSPHWTVTIYGHFVVGGYRARLANLPCKFGCFFKAGDSQFYSDLAIFYVSVATVEVIDFAIQTGWIDCP